MSFPAVLIIAAKKIIKEKAIGQIANLLLKADPDKVGMIVSYTGSLKKGIKFVRKYRKVAAQAAESIAKNQNIIAELKRGVKKGNKKKGGNARWSIPKAEKNIKRAMGAKSRFVKKTLKKEIKKKVLSMVPARRIAMSAKDLYKAIHNKKSAIKIGKALGSLISKMGGGRDIAHIFNMLDTYSSIDLTVNHFWKRISDNHNPSYPIIGRSGGASLRYILTFKQKYKDQFFDRPFYFYVNSPQTGNFSTGIHCYNPVEKEYTLPIRGWGGNGIRSYTFTGDKPTLSSVVNICCNGKIDFGSAIYNVYIHPFRWPEERPWIAIWYRYFYNKE